MLLARKAPALGSVFKLFCAPVVAADISDKYLSCLHVFITHRRREDSKC